MALGEQRLDQDKANKAVEQAKERYFKKLPVDARILTEEELAKVVPPPFDIRPLLTRVYGKVADVLSPIPPSLSRFLGSITGM